jgi:hypothetical protein
MDVYSCGNVTFSTGPARTSGCRFYNMIGGMSFQQWISPRQYDKNVYLAVLKGYFLHTAQIIHFYVVISVVWAQTFSAMASNDFYIISPT